MASKSKIDHREYEMKKEDRDFLIDNHVFLMNEISFMIERLIDHLYQRRVLTCGMLYELKEMTSNMHKARWLLILLPRRGPNAFSQFTEVIGQYGLLDLHDILLTR